MAYRQDKSTQSKQESPRAMDPAWFTAQFNDVYPRLHLIALGIIGDRTYADDIVQEAAIIALEKADQFTPGTSHVAWLSEIVRRCSLNYARKIRGRKTAAADPDVLAASTEEKSMPESAWPIRPETGELVSDQSEFDDALIGALNKISAEARCCLLLRTVQNLTYAEISELMHVPEGTAMSHVHRSRRHLRNSLERDAATRKIVDGNT